MANRSCRRRTAQTIAAAPPTEARPAPAEPVMRHWPHPIPTTNAEPQCDPMLHYIRCALAYQNEVLCEIKTLLEELLATRETDETGQ